MIIGFAAGWTVSDLNSIERVAALQRRLEAIYAQTRDVYEKFCRVDMLPKVLIEDMTTITDFRKLVERIDKDLPSIASQVTGVSDGFGEMRKRCDKALNLAEESAKTNRDVNNTLIDINNELRNLVKQVEIVDSAQQKIILAVSVEDACPDGIGCRSGFEPLMGAYLSTGLNKLGSGLDEVRQTLTEPNGAGPISELRRAVKATSDQILTAATQLNATTTEVARLIDRTDRRIARGYQVQDMTLVAKGDKIRLRFRLPDPYVINCGQVQAVIIPTSGSDNIAIPLDDLVPNGDHYCAQTINALQTGQSEVPILHSGQSFALVVYLRDPNPRTSGQVQ